MKIKPFAYAPIQLQGVIGKVFAEITDASEPIPTDEGPLTTYNHNNRTIVLANPVGVESKTQEGVGRLNQIIGMYKDSEKTDVLVPVYLETGMSVGRHWVLLHARYESGKSPSVTLYNSHSWWAYPISRLLNGQLLDSIKKSVVANHPDATFTYSMLGVQSVFNVVDCGPHIINQAAFLMKNEQGKKIAPPLDRAAYDNQVDQIDSQQQQPSTTAKTVLASSGILLGSTAVGATTSVALASTVGMAKVAAFLGAGFLLTLPPVAAIVAVSLTVALGALALVALALAVNEGLESLQNREINGLKLNPECVERIDFRHEIPERRQNQKMSHRNTVAASADADYRSTAGDDFGMDGDADIDINVGPRNPNV